MSLRSHLKQALKRNLSPSLVQRLQTAHNVWRALCPRRFQRVLFRADRLPEEDVGDLDVEIVEPRMPVSDMQRAFITRDTPDFSLWRLMWWQRRGHAWIFFARNAGEYCHYTWVTPACRTRRVFPIVRERDALLIGPCSTDSRFRGRSIYPRMLRHTVQTMQLRGYGPFYISTSVTNEASIRGISKAGFTRCGVWAGASALCGHCALTRRVAD